MFAPIFTHRSIDSMLRTARSTSSSCMAPPGAMRPTSSPLFRRGGLTSLSGGAPAACTRSASTASAPPAPRRNARRLIVALARKKSRVRRTLPLQRTNEGLFELVGSREVERPAARITHARVPSGAANVIDVVGTERWILVEQIPDADGDGRVLDSPVRRHQVEGVVRVHVRVEPGRNHTQRLLVLVGRDVTLVKRHRPRPRLPRHARVMLPARVDVEEAAAAEFACVLGERLVLEQARLEALEVRAVDVEGELAEIERTLKVQVDVDSLGLVARGVDVAADDMLDLAVGTTQDVGSQNLIVREHVGRI